MCAGDGGAATPLAAPAVQCDLGQPPLLGSCLRWNCAIPQNVLNASAPGTPVLEQEIKLSSLRND